MAFHCDPHLVNFAAIVITLILPGFNIINL
jgi:hypothetical protein